MRARPDDDPDRYEFTESYGRPEYVRHWAVPGLPTRVLTACGKTLDGLLMADDTEAGLPERACGSCREAAELEGRVTDGQ
jgi:hypothetical protein